MSGPDTERDRIAGLLVFLANGSLTGAEKAEVEALVAADPGLQAELAVLQEIRAQMHAEALPQSPGAFGQARLLREITREAAPSRPNLLWQGIAAAAVLLVLGQAYLYRSGDDLSLAGGGQEAASGPILTVAFAGDATEADIRALLIELNLSIVSGPSALGLYRLAAADEAARTAALARLTAASALVDSAEAEE